MKTTMFNTISQYIRDKITSNFNYYNLKEASEVLRSNKQYVIEAINHSKLNTDYIPLNFRDDIDVMSVAIKKNPVSLSIASERLRDNKDLVLEALMNIETIPVLQYASERIKNIFDIGFMAVSINPESYKDLSEDLKNNPGIGFATLTGLKNIGKDINESLKKKIIEKFPYDEQIKKFASKPKISLDEFLESAHVKYASWDLNNNSSISSKNKDKPQ